jgi:thiol-disulfide isomerase/thioredoxin
MNMKHFMLPRILTTLTGIALVIATLSAEAKLTVGDPAPKLQVAKWVQGDPVTAFDTNHVYIVEFWATWCGPCRSSIPHLNELWQKFKDRGLVAIGQDMAEPDDSGVAPFVKKMGDQMTYRVALDDKSQETNGFMSVHWMKAAEQNGIPTAFIVNQQGRIAWIGHPMSLNEQTLEDILAGHFDITKFAAEYERQQQVQAQKMELSKKLRTALKNKDWDAADAALADLEKTTPENARYQFGTKHLQILLGRKDYDGAYKLAESLSNEGITGLQNGLAWTLATGISASQSQSAPASCALMRILIATVTAGGGHIAAAAALEEAWRALRPDDTVERLDLIKFFSPLHKKIHADGYVKLVERAPELWGMLFGKTDNPKVARRLSKLRRAFPSNSRKKFARHLKQFKPDVVLCTHYLPLETLGLLRKKERGWAEFHDEARI